MICLDIQEYCSDCFDFDPYVKRPEKIQFDVDTIIIGDTLVRCSHAKRCENIRRYLKQQAEGGKNNE